MRPRGTGRRAERRRRRRAEAAAAELDEILTDAIALQARRIVQGYAAAAKTLTTGTLVAAGGEDAAAPAVEAAGLWNQAEWQAALAEAEAWFGGFVVDELQVGLGIEFTVTQPFIEGIVAEHVDWIDDWSADLRAKVADIVQDGHRRSLSIAQVAEALAEAGETAGRHATTIARTETVSASNAATHKGIEAIAEPGDMKVWMAARDHRTRDDHKKAHGQRVPVGEDFVVGRERGAYPGAATFSPAQRANCRCTFRLELGDR